MTSTQATSDFSKIASALQAADSLGSMVLAAAISVKCPKAQVIRASSDSYGFSLEFYWNESLSTGFLSFIEEEMRVILKKEEIKIFEMMRDNAADFLNFHHQKRKAKQLKEWENGLVKVIKVDTYVDLLEEEFDLEEALEYFRSFKLIALESNQQQDAQGKKRFHLRVKGVSASSQVELKNFVKVLKEANKYFHLRYSQHFSLVKSEEGDGFIWYPEGLKLKNHLINSLKNIFFKQGYEELEFSCVERDFSELDSLEAFPSFMYMHDESTELDRKEPDLGLYSLENTKCLSLVKGSKNNSLESSISSLITTLSGILDSLKLVSLVVFKECEIQKKDRAIRVKKGGVFKKVLDTINYPRGLVNFLEEETEDCYLSFVVKDCFERSWEVASIEIEDKKNPSYVRMTMISIERWVALLLDHSKSSLPQISLI